ncbi:hypothetical protein QYM36_009670 [Artemia franciscana]|uniref:Uncharacterized protein n=1 Tax=Artemia franciscana TaxID=6661 RepID=A0AA88I220_ARTSF|nr:hypothetical protein QYM36_009670 [Artemia franciscana]
MAARAKKTRISGGGRSQNSTYAKIEKLSRLQLFDEITNANIYKKDNPPESDGTLEVEVSIIVNAFGNIKTRDTKFQSQLTIQQSWKDKRLSFVDFATDLVMLKGEEDFANKIWRPSIIVTNEASSSVITVPQSNSLVKVYQDGTVIYSYRIRSETYCSLYLLKYPFDRQQCNVFLESWSLPKDKLLLKWKEGEEVDFVGRFPIQEFSKTGHTIKTLNNTRLDGQTYSMLSLEVHLAREYGFFIIDWYIPSIILVFMSWVSFWIDPSSVPARVNFGIGTVFTYVVLRRLMANLVPRTGVAKALDSYSLICLIYMFSTLIEYAIVNTVWRRTKELEIRKLSAKNVLKSAMSHPSSRRQSLSLGMSTSSVFDLNQLSMDSLNETGPRQRAGALANDSQHHMSTSTLTTSCNSFPDLQEEEGRRNSTSNPSSSGEGAAARGSAFSSSNMVNGNLEKPVYYLKPHQAGKYIDRRARILFPVSFLIVNAIYWTWVVL